MRTDTFRPKWSRGWAVSEASSRTDALTPHRKRRKDRYQQRTKADDARVVPPLSNNKPEMVMVIEWYDITIKGGPRSVIPELRRDKPCQMLNFLRFPKA